LFLSLYRSGILNGRRLGRTPGTWSIWTPCILLEMSYPRCCPGYPSKPRLLYGNRSFKLSVAAAFGRVKQQSLIQYPKCIQNGHSRTENESIRCVPPYKAMLCSLEMLRRTFGTHRICWQNLHVKLGSTKPKMNFELKFCEFTNRR